MKHKKAYFKHPQTHVMVDAYDPQLSEGSVVPPVFRTSTFCFRNCAEGKRAFQLAYGLDPARPGEVSPLIYTRVNNPNAEIVEDRIIAWDKADSSALFSSGMGAISCMAFTFLRPGDSLLFADPVYGGTEYLFRHILPDFGVETRSYPAGAGEREIETVAKTMANLKVIFMETCANPTLRLNDIRAARKVADSLSPAPLVAVDNTFMGPLFCQPLDLGADLVVYSATKFIGGHSDLVAGFVLGPKDLVTATKATRTIFGASPDPETAWLIGRSMGTLHLRMQTQARSAQQVVRYLQSDGRVESVRFPGDPIMGEDQLRLYREQCSGPGSLISFTVRGGEEEAFCVLDSLALFHLAVSLGGIESLAEHPYTMTHAELSHDLKMEAGITPNLVRLSVGLEDTEDLIDDIRQALDRMEAMGRIPKGEKVGVS